MGCPPVVFNGVDANAWACLKQKAAAFAQAHNYPLPPLDDTGSASHLGFSAEYTYDPNAGTLTITCTGHPFFFSCEKINAQVQSGIASTGCIPGLIVASK
jgi:hypothetical protein